MHVTSIFVEVTYNTLRNDINHDGIFIWVVAQGGFRKMGTKAPDAI